MADQSTYEAKDIQVLEGLEPVRKRPGMYIGSTDERGLHHMIVEVVDNSIDEALAGYASEISVVVHKDSSVTIGLDECRGTDEFQLQIAMHALGVRQGIDLVAYGFPGFFRVQPQTTTFIGVIGNDQAVSGTRDEVTEGGRNRQSSLVI